MTSALSSAPAWDQKRVLVVWYCNTQYIPPFRLSERQVTVGVPEPGYTSLPHLDAVLTKSGKYDLAEQLNAAQIDKAFDLIVVASDASRRNCPVNLDAFDCPKVLWMGDTHHLNKPLQFMLNYAGSVRYDALVSTYNRQHLHWFLEAGHNNCAWLPGLTAVHIPTSLVVDRERCVSFLGQSGKMHPFRTKLLQAIKSANIPLRIVQGSRAIGASLYSTSVLSFNASLNGDLNMRVFEVLSAAGCLVTDRLSPYSGLSELFEEGSEILCYGGVEELLATIERYLAEPEAALEIGKAGHRRFIEQYTQRRQRDVLFDWVFGGKLEQRYRADADARARLKASPNTLKDRLELYEALQELHRLQDRPCVLVSSRVTPRVCSDAADLPRLQIAQLATRATRPESSQEIARLSIEQASRQTWDFMLVASGEDAPAGIRALRVGSVAQALVD